MGSQGIQATTGFIETRGLKGPNMKHEPMLLPIALLLASSVVGAPSGEPLPGTQVLTIPGDLSMQMLEGVDRFLLEETERSVSTRQRLWNRDYSSHAAYARSVSPNRERLRQSIGAVDARVAFDDLELVAGLRTPSLVAESERVRVQAVRWPVLDGVDAEGLLLEPRGAAQALIVALPEADWTPETTAGVGHYGPLGASFARRFAEAGCRVLVPTLIDRDYRWSGNPMVRMSNQPHREFLYRQAYFMGRHIIGYEVQKVLAAVDYFARLNQQSGLDIPIGVAGYGEGALIAFYSAALDSRIDAAWVSGYFQQREKVWQEPLYRNVFGLLREFGDAEIASLIAPRALTLEACRGPQASPPPPRYGMNHAGPGSLTTPPLASVQTEYERAREHYRQLGSEGRIRLVVSRDGTGSPGSGAALGAFLESLSVRGSAAPADSTPLPDRRAGFDPAGRMKRQFEQIGAHTQGLIPLSPFRRAEFWTKADPSSPETWRDTTRFYRGYLRHEIIGELPPPTVPANPRTRLSRETPNWKGYEVVLDVWPDVVAYGMLLVPKDLKPGERRPVVVAQHGRGGRPQEVTDPQPDPKQYMHGFGARLADRGFVVFAPQNLYIGEEQSRMIQRKANPLKLTFFAVMVRQHERVLEWLSSLPFVDPGRIGFYGISYGGKSAMLIPAAVEGYALSICSGDFTETVWKHASTIFRQSFMFTLEHEHTEFNMGETFNYSELAGLIAPRPFMVERGHFDGGMPDEWVAYEYAKARRLYVQLGIGDRTEIEFFPGRHEIHGRGTFDFLHKHLARKRPVN